MNVVMQEILAQAYAATALYASVHTDDPGVTGDNELGGGREPITWNVGTEDGEVVSDPVVFAVPDGTDLTHVGIWTDATGGDFLDSLANSVSFPVAGSYEVTLTYIQNAT